MADVEIRPERVEDIESIRDVTEQAFRGRPYAGGDEQDVIERLRNADALTLSLVALSDGVLVGHIAFSPATLSSGSKPWFALGPVSVLPSRQGEGIGTALIEQGLSKIKALGALGCILTGNPDYYRRFGFELAPVHVPADEAEAFFMLKLLAAQQPLGRFTFHRAFYG